MNASGTFEEHFDEKNIEVIATHSVSEKALKNDTVTNAAIGVGVGAAVGIAAPVVVLGGLAVMGFGAVGVGAGTFAAGMQSSSVAAGSLFASMFIINSIQNDEWETH